MQKLPISKLAINKIDVFIDIKQNIVQINVKPCTYAQGCHYAGQCRSAVTST